MTKYSPGYLADLWCSKGHILLCLDGKVDTELARPSASCFEGGDRS